MIRVELFLSVAITFLCVATQQSQAGFVNGDFETDNLYGWNVFKTANGTLGREGPQVVSFDTAGDGNLSLAAAFQVGEVSLRYVPEGGGIFQSFSTSGGNLTITADIAARKPDQLLNYYGGSFELLFDGLVVDSHDFGPIAGNTTERASISATVLGVAAGLHEIRFRILRPYLGSLGTPIQYIDNIVISSDVSAVPEPASLALMGLGGLGLMAGKIRKRRHALLCNRHLIPESLPCRRG